jgi:hypothetical protein
MLTGWLPNLECEEKRKETYVQICDPIMVLVLIRKYVRCLCYVSTLMLHSSVLDTHASHAEYSLMNGSPALALVDNSCKTLVRLLLMTIDL